MSTQVILSGHLQHNGASPTATAQVVGNKALGLLALPLMWTLPFFVIPPTFAAGAPQKKKRRNNGLQNSPLHDSQSFESALAALRQKGFDTVIARSSSTSETLDDRGLYESHVCDATPEAVLAAANRIRNQASKIGSRRVQNVAHMAVLVQGYGKVFCKLLGSVYDNIKAGEPVFLSGLICQPFYFGKKPTNGWFADDDGKALHELIYHKHHDSLRTVRMLRFYADNVMLIVKPDRLRFWIRSTAIRDADETAVALREQGY